MRIYTKSGDLAFKTFTFPDGQPHFKLETYEIEFTSATVEMAIKTPADLLMAGMVSQVLRQHGYREINLDVRYLMGARMDRAIASDQPHTLSLVAQTVNAMGFSKVRVLDVHSEVATRLIRNSENVLPRDVVAQVKASTGYPWVVCPDKGAEQRLFDLGGFNIKGSKIRDMQTGNLKGFEINQLNIYLNTAQKQEVLIVDDICDGGGTFTGLAKVLREAGAKKVYLYVTHGIFSKGLPLEGIDQIYTTDSYIEKLDGPYDGDSYRLLHTYAKATVIPISMKEIK